MSDCVQPTQYLEKPLKVRPNAVLMQVDKTGNFRDLFTQELIALFATFRVYNFELRMVGGAVRDILMGKKPVDIDLATTATPSQVKDMFTREGLNYRTHGEKHGTITVHFSPKLSFEVTTLRADVATDGRHAEVKFTTNWQLDAKRRDLTINSMYLGLDGTVYDYYYGYEDLLKRRVVFVGDAGERIKEDYLRILRYFRFYGRIATEPNKHDAATLQAIRANASGLANIASERIWSELQKICEGKFAKELLLEMIQCGVAPYCGLPLQPNLQEFQRVCSALQNFEDQKLAIVYLAALLNNRSDALKLAERLKLQNFDKDLACFIVAYRGRADALKSTDYSNLCTQYSSKVVVMQNLMLVIFR